MARASWRRTGWLWAALMVGVLGAQDAPDQLKLRSGTLLSGRFTEGDKDTIVFRTGDGLRVFKRAEVAAIFLGGAEAPAGEFPPGFSAVAPLKLKRVATYRRITRNKVVDNGQLEPEAVKISADGSKLVFWAPKSGLYSLNPDGSGQTLLVKADGTEHGRIAWDRLELSPDGKSVFWQGGWPLYRINTDGTGEQLLLRNGAEYTTFKVRENGARIFYSQRGGIWSIDTAGRGDQREVINPRKLSRLWEVPEDWCLLTPFDASEDGTKVVFVVGGYPKAKEAQLLGINADGSGLHRICPTDFRPEYPTFTPDGKHILFWKYGGSAYLVPFDGGEPRALSTPHWDGNHSSMQQSDRFTADGQSFFYNAGYAGGPTLLRLDTGERFEPYATGPWDGYGNPLFWGLGFPAMSADGRRFVAMSQYWQQNKPRQVVVTDVNPRTADGLPALGDISFPELLSTNPNVPQNRGTIKVRVRRGETDVERVQFVILPASQLVGDRWIADRGVTGLVGGHVLTDDGKQGDATAGDGVWTSDLFAAQPGDNKLAPGRYLVRILAHDDQHAVVADVDGVEIR